MNYRTLSNMAETIRQNIHRIPKLPVVGIPRSGMIAASMIATLKNVPLLTYNELLALSMGPEHILLVDDSVSGGETMAKVRSHFRQIDGVHMPDVTTFAVYVKPTSPKPDVWLEEIPGPRVFEWNWHKHAYTKRAVFDIDGVICTDRVKLPKGSSEEEYAKSSLAVSPLFIPKRKVLAIATGRHDDHGVTVDWLAAHGVRYEHIYFSNPERGAQRTKLLALQETDAHWMVESNASQAAWLASRSGRPVLCTDLNQMLPASSR